MSSPQPAAPPPDAAVPPPPAASAATRPRFCAECGAQLSAGAQFCHRCGAATAGAGAAPAPGGGERGLAGVLPWAVALVALIALVANVAGRNFGAARGSGLDGSANALPQAALGEVPAAGAAPAAAPGAGAAPVAPFAGGAAGGAPGGTGRPPDLRNMNPRDIADRLFDRVMRLSGEGKADSAGFFATMALQHYASMPSQGVPFDADLRYDMGRIAEVAGRGEVAAAQADTILRAEPAHLLGLVLAIKGAVLTGNTARAAEMRRRLAAAEPAERRRGLEEYTRHGNDIDAALRQAAVPAPTAPAPR
jgi:hypothetical protein